MYFPVSYKSTRSFVDGNHSNTGFKIASDRSMEIISYKKYVIQKGCYESERIYYCEGMIIPSCTSNYNRHAVNYWINIFGGGSGK